MYKFFLRPFLFRMDPEKAHSFAFRFLTFMKRLPFGGSLVRLFCKKKVPDTASRTVFGIKFPHPVGLAAGLDKNAEFYNPLSWCGFSFVEVGSLTPEPQPGNPRPRLFRLPEDQALVNRMGLGNKGIEYAVAQIRRDRPTVILAGSIARNSSSQTEEEICEDYKRAFSTIYDFVDFITLNVSCPNVEGLQQLQEAEFLARVVDPLLEMRLASDSYRPILVKVSPDLSHEQVDAILHYCRMSGIDGVVASNTTRSREGLVTAPETVEQIGKGGLSGAPLFERSLEMVRYIREKTGGCLPIIGVGGIMTPAQAREMLDAGASLIEVYTGFIYEGPRFVRRILKHLYA